MVGIFSQGGSAGHRYAGWLSEVEAKNFQFGGKVFNGSPSAIYVGSNLVWAGRWLTGTTLQAILGAFGQTDGMAVINATIAYLTQLAASDRDKATALAGFINQWVPTYPMTILEFAELGYCVATGDAASYFDTGYIPKNNSRLEVRAYLNGQNRMFLGTRSGYSQNGFGIGYDPTDKIMYDGWTGRTLYNQVTLNNWYKFAIDLAQGKGYCDDVEFNLDVTSGSFGSATKPLFMLAINNNGSVAYWNATSCIVAGSKIYEGNALVHWWMPIENNKILDVVTGDIITKSGSGTVTYSTQYTHWTPSTP